MNIHSKAVCFLAQGSVNLSLGENKCPFPPIHPCQTGQQWQTKETIPLRSAYVSMGNLMETTVEAPSHISTQSQENKKGGRRWWYTF